MGDKQRATVEDRSGGTAVSEAAEVESSDRARNQAASPDGSKRVSPAARAERNAPDTSHSRGAERNPQSQEKEGAAERGSSHAAQKDSMPDASTAEPSQGTGTGKAAIGAGEESGTDEGDGNAGCQEGEADSGSERELPADQHPAKTAKRVEEEAPTEAENSGVRSDESESEGDGSANSTLRDDGARSKADIVINHVEKLTAFESESGPSETPILDRLLSDLPARPPHLGPVDPSFYGPQMSSVAGDPLIVVSCFDFDVAVAAAYALIEEEFPGQERKILYLERSWRHEPVFGRAGNGRGSVSQEDITIGSFRNWLSLSEGHRVVLVPVEESSSLLDSLEAEQYINVTTVQESLKENGTTLILGTRRKPFERLDHPDRVPFGIWHIPYLAHLLHLHFDPVEVSLFERRLREQQRAGLWADRREDFFYEVGELLKGGREELLKHIEAREGGELPAEASRVTARDLIPRELVDPGLIHWVIALAVNFPDLTWESFNQLVTALLRGEHHHAEVEEEVWRPRGQTEIEKKFEQRRLLEAWEENPDQVLRDARLGSIERPDGTRVIGFTTPFLRSDLRSILDMEYPALIARIFRGIGTGGLLFDPNLPSDLRDRLISSTIDKMLDRPGDFEDQWLLRAVFGARATSETQAEEVLPDGERDSLFGHLCKLMADGMRWETQCRGLAELVREMLRHPQLNESAHRFLHALMKRGERDVILKVVVFLAHRLRFERDFDALYWLQQLIDQGNSTELSEVEGNLHRLAANSGQRVWNILATIRDWLPTDGRPRERYAVSAEVALNFAWTYCIATAKSAQLFPEGRWPSELGLFRGIDDGNGDRRARISDLVGWLLHPELASLFNAYVVLDEEGEEPVEESVREARLVLLGFLIVRWSLILTGTDPNSEGVEEAEALLDLLLSVCSEHLERDQARQVDRYLRDLQDQKLQDLVDMPVSCREERLEIKAERKKLKEVRKRFAAHVRSRRSTGSDPIQKGARS